MTQSTRQEIIDAYTAVTTLARLAEEFTPVRVEEHKEINDLHLAVRAVLPPLPQPTMAEVEWDDELYYLAEAEHTDFGKVIMLGLNAYSMIDFFAPERYASRFKDTHPANLTPTGKRYTLTEVQDD